MQRNLATDALRWIAIGRDVLILGDEGSGRSTTLRRLCKLAVSGGTNVLHLTAFRSPSSPPLAALLAHRTISGAISEPRPSLSELVRIVVDEFQGSKSLLAIDDIDMLDNTSLSVIEEVLRRTSCRLAASLANSALEDPTNSALQVLAQRAPAELRTEALGEWEMTVLLASRLQSPPDLALTSSILTRSGGNPAVALALIDAARWSCAVELRGGIWTLRRNLDTVPHDAVVNALTRRLDREQVHALQMLSWAGPVSTDDALALVGAGSLAQLAALHRVTTVTTQGTELTAVTPPALSHGLLAQMTAGEYREIAAQAADRCGNLAAVHRLREAAGTEPSAERSRQREAHWPTVTAAFVMESIAARQSQRRSAWLGDPSVTHATELLDVLGLDCEQLVREVFELTARGPDDDVDVVSKFLDQYRNWITWCGEDDDSAALAERLRHDSRIYSTWHVDSEWLSQVAMAITAGDPRTALGLLDSREPRRGDAAARARHLAARCDAMVLAGSPLDALRTAQSALAAAVCDLDKHAIQMHAVSVAGLHIIGGNYTEAWEPITLAVRLGPPGPFEHPRVLRILAFGAALQARSGNTRFGWQLLHELERRESSPSSILTALTAWARAEIHYAENEPEAGDTLLWTNGVQEAEAGNLTAAMLSWAPRAGIYTSDQIERISDFYDEERLPFFRNILAVHRALSEGDADGAIDNLAKIHSVLGPAQGKVALERINELRQAAGREPLAKSEVSDAAAHISRLDIALQKMPTADEPLSDRERQVALFARNGMSNREIASRLFLSVRTVESHMYRVLRKLGLSSRAELLTAWDPDGSAVSSG